jgi:hypothetical protein
MCAALCFPEIKGNGICNLECDSIDCDFDSNDCLQEVWVDANAAVGGNGSHALPYNSIEASFKRAYASSKAVILLLPGTYQTMSLNWTSTAVKYLNITCTGDPCVVETLSYETTISISNLTELVIQKLQFEGFRETNCSSCTSCVKAECTDDACQYSMQQVVGVALCSMDICSSKRKALVSITQVSNVTIQSLLFTKFAFLRTALELVRTSSVELTDLAAKDLSLFSAFIAVTNTDNPEVFCFHSCDELRYKTKLVEGSLKARGITLTRVNKSAPFDTYFCRALEHMSSALLILNVALVEVTGVTVSAFSKITYESFSDYPALIEVRDFLNSTLAEIKIDDSLTATPIVRVKSGYVQDKPVLELSRLTVSNSVVAAVPIVDLGTANWDQQIKINDLWVEAVGGFSEVVEVSQLVILTSAQKTCLNQTSQALLNTINIISVQTPESSMITASNLGTLKVSQLNVEGLDDQVTKTFFDRYYTALGLKPQAAVQFTVDKDFKTLLPSTKFFTNGLVLDREVDLTHILNANVSGVTCKNSLLMSQASMLEVEGMTLRNNKVGRLVEQLHPAKFSKFEVNANTAAAHLLRFSSSQLIIQDANFALNSVLNGPGLAVEGSAVLGNLTLSRNYCDQGCFKYRPQPSSNSLTISGGLWLGNRAKYAADLYFEAEKSSLTRATIINSKFQGADATESSVMSFDTQALLDVIVFQNCEFSHVALPTCDYCEERAAISLRFLHGRLEFKDCLFTDFQGPSVILDIKVGSLHELPAVLFERSVFSKNSAEILINAGYLKKVQHFETVNCLFNDSTVVEIVKLVVSNYTDRGSYFQSNNATSALIIADASDLELKGTTIVSNILTNTGACLKLFKSTSKVQGVSFLSNQVQFNAVVSLSDSSLEAETSTFEGNSNTQVDLYVSRAKLDRVSFTGNTDFSVTAKFSDIEMRQLTCTAQPYCIQAESSSVALLTANFTDVDANVLTATSCSIKATDLYIDSSSGITVSSSQVSGTNWFFKSVRSISFASCKAMTVLTATMVQSDSLSVTSSSAAFEDFSFSRGNHTFLNSQASDLRLSRTQFKAGQDSAVRASNSTLKCEACTFENNSGSQGGALRLSQTASEFTNSSFNGNSASQGGAIFWEGVRPVLTNCSFASNEAVHGNDTATPAVELALSDSTLSTLRSGGSLNPLEAYLIDSDQQVVSVHSAVYVQVVGVNVTLKGTSQFRFNAGRAQIERLQAFAEPGSAGKLVVLSEGFLEQSIDLSFRLCIAGEEPLKDYSCYRCENSTYSLVNNSACLQCPQDAICDGGNVIYPRAGYWRSSELTKDFYECVYKESCLQGSSFDQAYKCQTGYEGLLCNNCREGYHKRSSRECAECPEPWLNALMISLAGVLTVSMHVVLVASTIRNATKKQSASALHFKLLVNYFQAISLVTSLAVNWPTSLFTLFQVFSLTSSTAQSLMSFECEIQDTSAVYVNLVIATTVPVVLLLGALTFWSAVAWVKKSKDYLKLHFPSTCVIIVFVMLPSVTEATFTMLGCMDFEDSSYLVADLSQECWVGTHFNLVLGVAFPAVLTWCVLAPGFIFVMIRRNKASLRDRQVQLKYGYLYNGYVDKYFFWEFLVIFRKLSIKAAIISFAGYSVSVQALAVLAIQGGSAIVQQAFHPFEKLTVNRLEQVSIISATSTVVCGLLFMEDIGSVLTIVVNTAAFAINLGFILLWLVSFCRASRKSAVISAITRRLSSLSNSITRRLTMVRSKSSSVSPLPDGEISNLSITTSEFRLSS